MNIGIIGTRGIPNQYGGFEQFAEFVAPALVERGHQVAVYNSSLHPFHESTWKNVLRITKYDPENRLGSFGQFIYDFNCIVDSRKRKFDIILQLGYTSSSIWSFLYPKNSILITNMDGLEWKRSKYGASTRKFLLKAERWAAIHSDCLIADSTGIQAYLMEKYHKEAAFIAYGATLFTEPDAGALTQYGLRPYSYDLLIARMEPENNIEAILRGHQASAASQPILLIGGYSNDFGRYLKNKYENAQTIFLGPIYDFGSLNNLRHFSHYYFHGHSVGGTNPSLLEAMASQALILAHDNVFNRSVLGEDAQYFLNSDDIKAVLDIPAEKKSFSRMIENNNEKIVNNYSWKMITDQLESYLTASLKRKVR
jgi:glycosyltransferase involved in cell wall biosynthesis